MKRFFRFMMKVGFWSLKALIWLGYIGYLWIEEALEEADRRRQETYEKYNGDIENAILNGESW